jgi:hypothetical protein
MKVLSIEKPEEPTAWFEIGNGGRVQLCILSPETYRKIVKGAVRKKVEYAKVDGKAERFEVVEEDQEVFALNFWDAVIRSWEGMPPLKDGSVLECTAQNKLLMIEYGKIIDEGTELRFSDFIQASLEQFRKDEAEKAEAVRKNSLSGQSGSTSSPHDARAAG